MVGIVPYHHGSGGMVWYHYGTKLALTCHARPPSRLSTVSRNKTIIPIRHGRQPLQPKSIQLLHYGDFYCVTPPKRQGLSIIIADAV